MNDPIAYSTGMVQGSADAANHVSSATPPEFEGNADYAAGYAEGLAGASGPVSTPDPTDPSGIYRAGVEHGAADRASQSSSPASPGLENTKEHAEGYTVGSDPEAYAAGEQAGRADTVQHRSSETPPEYEGNQAYAQGYADGAAASPYLSDVDAQNKAEAGQREQYADEQRRQFADDYARQRERDQFFPPVPNSPGQQTMSATPPGTPREPPEYGEDGEMPHAEYGPEHPGQTWDPKTHSWRWTWEIDGPGAEGEGEGEAAP